MKAPELLQHAASFAKHFGITVSTEDITKIAAAIQNAYATGKIDEREQCAQICELHADGWQKNPGQNLQAGYIASSNCAYAIRERGQP